MSTHIVDKNYLGSKHTGSIGGLVYVGLAKNLVEGAKEMGNAISLPKGLMINIHCGFIRCCFVVFRRLARFKEVWLCGYEP